MKLRFLADDQRRAVTAEQKTAIVIYQKTFERGQFLLELGDFDGAAQQSGCALEAAQILMYAQSCPDEEALDRFSNAGLQLVNTLMCMQEKQLANQVHRGVVEHLETLLSGNEGSIALHAARRQWLAYAAQINPDATGGKAFIPLKPSTRVH